MSGPFTLTPEGLRLAVRVTVRAKRNEVSGLVATPDRRQAVGIRLAAPPVDGAANKALCRLLADLFELPVAAVEIASGASSRLKLVALRGEADDIARKLQAILRG